MNIHTTYINIHKKIIVFARIIINGHGGVRENFPQKKKEKLRSLQFSSRVDTHYVYTRVFFHYK